MARRAYRATIVTKTTSPTPKIYPLAAGTLPTLKYAVPLEKDVWGTGKENEAGPPALWPETPRERRSMA